MKNFKTTVIAVFAVFACGMVYADEFKGMKIAIACDHAGFELKETLKTLLTDLGHQITDLGADSPSKPVDYPDFAEKAVIELKTGRAERAIVICGSGIGVCIAANKFPGIRAGLCHDTYSAKQSVEHDNVNVLCLGARVIGAELAKEITKVWLAAKFAGGEKHKRRLEKIAAFERSFGTTSGK